MIKKILVGSRAFFGDFPDFQSKDWDYLQLDENPRGYKWRYEISLRGTDLFRYKLESPQKMIARTIESGDALLLGKFLVPEVAQVLGLTPTDILPLGSLLGGLDEKHQYEEVIFKAIRENQDFHLTPSQLSQAYLVYKEGRKR